MKGVDDVVQAVPVHLGAGVWGVLAAGLFAAPDAYADTYSRHQHLCCGLFYGCGGRQLGLQLVFLVVVLPWVAITAGSLFFLCHRCKVRDHHLLNIRT